MEDTTCYICLDPIEEPYKLNCCKYSFCKSCIVSWVRTFGKKATPKKKSACCPMCRKPIKPQYLRPIIDKQQPIHHQQHKQEKEEEEESIPPPPPLSPADTTLVTRGQCNLCGMKTGEVSYLMYKVGVLCESCTESYPYQCSINRKRKLYCPSNNRCSHCEDYIYNQYTRQNKPCEYKPKRILV